MFMADPQVLAGLILAASIFGIVLTIAWIILPFALIGTKPLLRELIRETKRTNELLARGQPVGRREPTL
jgi:hypothetical protein